jgi:adenine deaminase
MNDVRGIAAMGAFVEHSLCMFLDGSKFKVCEGEDLKKHIDAAGISQTILCSDLGQTGTFSPLEGFRRGVRLCIDLGYDDGDIRTMVSTNAAKAFNLQDDVKRLQTSST